MPRILSQNDVTDFRDRLCEAALKRFAEEGEAGISLRRLAGDLGVSPTTPYRYFRDKNEIVAAIRAQAFDRFADKLERAFQSSDDVRARADAVGRAYVAFAFADPQAYRLMFDLVQPDESLYPDLARAGQRARATMSAHLHAMKAAGKLAGDPELIGHVFWSALHGLIVLHLAGKLCGGPDFDAIFAETSRLLSLGLAADAHSARPQPRSRI